MNERWSAPIEVTRCELPDRDAFCGGVALHPALDEDPAALLAAYTIASFKPISDEARATRLVRLPLPPRLVLRARW